MRFELDGIEPMGAVRMTRNGKFMRASTSSHYKSTQKYLNYKNAIGLMVKSKFKGELLDGPLHVDILFKMPIPDSWSKKRKQEAIGRLHVKKPDIDNMVKGLFDAVNGLIWVDDNRVAAVSAGKVYSDKPGISFKINQIGGFDHGQAETQEETEQATKGSEKSGAGQHLQ